MDCFETIAATLLEVKGYWVRRGFKVNLTKEAKKNIGKSSMPRPEIDLLAFKPKENRIIAFEVKSYLDSPGVPLKEITASRKTPEGRYKIFTCKHYRKVVLEQLKTDLIKKGMATKSTNIELGLIAAKAKGGKDESKRMADHMRRQCYEFWGPSDIKGKLVELADLDYENDVAVITSKILNR